VIQESSISAPATSIVEPTAPTQSTTAASTQPTTQQVAVVQTVQPVVSQPTTQTTNNQQQQQSSGPTLSSVLNMIQSNARREQNIAASAVAAANEVAQTIVANTEQTALSVASTSSINSQQVTTQQTNTVQQTTNNQTANNNGLSQGVPLVSATAINQLATNNSLVSNNNIQQNTTPTQVYALPTNQVQAVNSTQATTEVRTVESDNVVFASNFLTNKTNPLTDIVENNVRPMNAVLEQKERPMNKNPANNELATGVDLERMALQPVGYNAYLQLALRDASFYAPKEIYRNQRVIDNQRAVRLLNFASELKHQEMVNQQYGEQK